MDSYSIQLVDSLPQRDGFALRVLVQVEFGGGVTWLAVGLVPLCCTPWGKRLKKIAFSRSSSRRASFTAVEGIMAHSCRETDWTYAQQGVRAVAKWLQWLRSGILIVLHKVKSLAPTWTRALVNYITRRGIRMDFGQPIVVRSAVTFTHHHIALTLLFTIHGNVYKRDCHAPTGSRTCFFGKIRWHYF